MKKFDLILDEVTRPIWETCVRAAKEVDSWPAWKRGEDVPESGRPPVSEERLPELGAPIRKR